MWSRGRYDDGWTYGWLPGAMAGHKGRASRWWSGSGRDSGKLGVRVGVRHGREEG